MPTFGGNFATSGKVYTAKFSVRNSHCPETGSKIADAFSSLSSSRRGQTSVFGSPAHIVPDPFQLTSEADRKTGKQAGSPGMAAR